MTDPKPVTLVTGAGSGIGRATAVGLAARGHRVALSGRREEGLRETGRLLGIDDGDWAALPADIADPAAAGALPGRVVAALGGLDAVVNNAGWTPMKPVADHTPEDVAAIFGVNAIGPTLICIAALRIMQDPDASTCGRIVNVSSMASGDPFPGLSVYGGAKASLNTLTRGIMNEAGDERDVKAFCVAPGAVETDLLRSILSADDLPGSACLTPEDVAGVITACVLGERDDEAGETIWLPSP